MKIQVYIHGDYDELLQWLIDTYPTDETSDNEQPYQIDPNDAWQGPYLHPMKQNGTYTDEEGKEYPRYERDTTRNDILVLIAAEGTYTYDEETETSTFNSSLLDTIPATVYIGKGRNELTKLLPEFALGQVIPYIS